MSTYDEAAELRAFKRFAKPRRYSTKEHPHPDWRFLEQRTEDAWRGWQARAWQVALDSERPAKRTKGGAS